MKEMFEQGDGASPGDPIEASRRLSRAPQRSRFYTTASVQQADGGFAVLLDAKGIRTPAKRPLVAPTEAIAEAIAAEWRAQQDTIDPPSMPLTRLANSVVDGVADRSVEVADDIAKYLGTDALFYRADGPQGLVARQAAHWDPVLFWAAERFGAHFILAEGVLHVQQPDRAVAAARSALPSDPWRLGAMHAATSLTGSALLALALQHGFLGAEAVWTAAHVDEDWNIETWGADEEASLRRAARLRDFEAAALVLETLRD